MLLMFQIFKAKTPPEREALRDGIRVEVEGITQDIGDMVVNLTKVLISLYPMFKVCCSVYVGNIFLVNIFCVVGFAA